MRKCILQAISICVGEGVKNKKEYLSYWTFLSQILSGPRGYFLFSLKKGRERELFKFYELVGRIRTSCQSNILPAKLLVPFLYPGYLSRTGSWSWIFFRRASSGRSVFPSHGETVGYRGSYLLQSMPF